MKSRGVKIVNTVNRELIILLGKPYLNMQLKITIPKNGIPNIIIKSLIK